MPKFKTFLRNNQDLLKLWYEDTATRIEERMAFPMRVIRFLTSTSLLFVFVYAFVNP